MTDIKRTIGRSKEKEFFKLGLYSWFDLSHTVDSLEISFVTILLQFFNFSVAVIDITKFQNNKTMIFLNCWFHKKHVYIFKNQYILLSCQFCIIWYKNEIARDVWKIPYIISPPKRRVWKYETLYWKESKFILRGEIISDISQSCQSVKQFPANAFSKMLIDA